MQTRVETQSPQLQIDSLPILFRISIIQTTVNGCCDFLAQCILVCIKNGTRHPFYWPKSSKIYRCWIVWGQDIRVVTIPSFLAIAYLGRSSYLHLISRFQFIDSSYLASENWCTNNICTRPHSIGCLGAHGVYNRSRHVHGRECPGDRLDRFQDPQVVLGS